VSVVDLTCRVKKAVTREKIDEAIQKAAKSKFKGIIKFTADAVVSSDFIGDPYPCIYDSSASILLNEHFIKLVAWYDNEWGYSNKVIDLIAYMASVDNA
ncbi:MAG: type I glyceraldehyde-3-phosphate dehydrogenase, partial [Clostridiales bacterium]|nr:type I glyceraldehyde-3-phosphate dehydrogenase [Clostridiales bacterium]